MSVQLTKFTEDMNKVSSLADQPTITSTALKAKFDEGGQKIKEYLNGTLVDEVQDAFQDLEGEIQDALEQIQTLLDALTAENISYDNTSSGMTATNVQAGIDELKGITNSLSTSIGSVNTTAGKKTVYSDFATTTGSANPSVAPLQDYSGTITVTADGWYPVAVAGYHFSRTYADMQLLRLQLTSKANGRAVVTYRILNADNTRTLTPNLYVDVLWVKIR